MASINLQEIERLTAVKEKEWKEANSMQISALAAALENKESECQEYKDMLIQLKKDFKYNLGLLQQRDRELERYDELIIRAKTTESAHLGEISDLRIKVAKLSDGLKREQQEKCDMQRHYRQQLANQQSSIETLKASKEDQIDDITSQLNNMRLSHERIETQLKAELEAQRFELNADFDEKFKENVKESKKKTNEMEAEVLAHELKCKFMEKELEHLQEMYKKHDGSLQEAEHSISNLQKQLLESENNAKNISTVKNARILELEAKVQSLIEQKTCVMAEFEEKRKQLDKDIRIKHSNIEVVRKNFSDKERQLEQQISKLRLQAEACEQETKRTLLDMQEMKRNQESTIETLGRNIKELKNRLENQAESYKASMVAKGVEIGNLQQKEIFLTAEIQRLNEDLRRKEKDVAEAQQKENLLLQSKVQLKLDMQQKFQEQKKQHDEETNHTIANLTKSRDDAVAELTKLKTQLRNEVMNQSDESVVAKDKMMELQYQNTQLKEVIEQMSEAMQNAVEGKENEEQPNNLKTDSVQTISPEYVASLESQVLHLKKEIRKVQELATVNEQHSAENTGTRITEMKLPRSKTAESSDVQKTICQHKPPESGLVLPNWKIKQRFDSRKQDQYIARALKSPSKAAYLISHLQEKLAKAVSQITLLSREKAQLLEIGNSLKSELGSLRRQGLQSEESSQNIKKGVQEEGGCEENDGVDENKLKQLEDLQYQLTKQELRFAQRDKLHKENLKQEQVPCLNLKDAHELIVPTIDGTGGVSAFSKGENKLQYSLSTVGDASARNIWSVLDQGMTSPSLPRSDGEHDHLNRPEHRKPPTREKFKSKSQGRRDRALKVRNYNVKDDEVARRREDHKR